MKIAAMIARYLMGLTFTVFGLNGFFHFLPNGTPPPKAVLFLTAMIGTHYFAPVFAVQIICGLVFLSGFYVPLALVVIAPVIFNILVFHTLMNPAGIGPGLVVLVCWLIVFYRYRSVFAGIFQPTTPGV